MTAAEEASRKEHCRLIGMRLFWKAALAYRRGNLGVQSGGIDNGGLLFSSSCCSAY